MTRIDETGEQFSETILRSKAELSIVASDLLDPSTRAAIQEVTQTRDGIRVKMHPKMPALLQLLDQLTAAEEPTRSQPALMPQSSTEKVIDFKAVREYYSKLSGQE